MTPWIITLAGTAVALYTAAALIRIADRRIAILAVAAAAVIAYCAFRAAL